MKKLDPYNARMICQKIVALVGAQKYSTLMEALGIKKRMAQKIFTCTMDDFPLSLLVQVSEQYGATFEYLSGVPAIKGQQLHPDAYVIAVVADQAFKRLSKLPELPALTPHNIDKFLAQFTGAGHSIGKKDGKNKE